MLLANEIETAFRHITDQEKIEFYLSIGWHIVDSQNPTEQTDTGTTEPPVIKEKYNKKTTLNFAGKPLSHWLAYGKKEELRKILRYIGIPFDEKAQKERLQKLLRDHIKSIKKGEAYDG